MPMTVIVTRNPSGRMLGFLASCACEIAPGVFTAPRMSKAVRQRVWRVLEHWHAEDVWDRDCALVMTWPDATRPGGQGVESLGAPRRSLIEHCGVHLAVRGLDECDAADVADP